MLQPNAYKCVPKREGENHLCNFRYVCPSLCSQPTALSTSQISIKFG